jgi:MraZ protein|tara:strand:- start:342 stop:806 length:465 start_codon:yes stop_codon:yes gene_type:complete
MLYEPFNTRLTLDPKGRLTLPIQLRHALAAHGINRLVAVGNDGDRGGLSLFTLEKYRSTIEARTADIDPFAPRSADFLRAVVSTNQTLTIDGNGRVLLPTSLRELAGIERDVVAFSMAGWFELWDRTRWEKSAFPAAVGNWTSGNPTSGAEGEQ